MRSQAVSCRTGVDPTHVSSMPRSAHCPSARVLPIGTSAHVGGTSSLRGRGDGRLRGPDVRPHGRHARPSRCAPCRTRSTSPIEPAGASTMRSPRSTMPCRGCWSELARMKRVWLRATVLALAVVGAVAGLTVYYSTDGVPRCLVSGVGTWRPPSDSRNAPLRGRDPRRFRVLLRHGLRSTGSSVRSPLAQAKWLCDGRPRQPLTRLRVERPEHGVAFETRADCSASVSLDLRRSAALRHALQGLHLEPALRARPADSRPLARAGPARALGARRAEQRRAHLRRERAPGPAASPDRGHSSLEAHLR